MKQQHAPFCQTVRAFLFAQKCVLLALDKAERRVKTGAAAQDTGLAVAGAEIVERDIEPARACAALRVLE